MSNVLTTRAIPPAAPIAEWFRLLVVSGPNAGDSVVIDDEVLVGSADTCAMQLSDPTVSRRHLSLRPSGTGVRAKDEDSRNGTWLGESRLFDAELAPDTELRIGASVLRIELVHGDASKRPRKAAADLPTRESFGRFIGRSPALQPLYAQLEKAVGTNATVLLEGESGTGKELLAEAIHEESKRSDKPFVVVDCGALPDNLIESELFGHERGAFTGADRAREGAFELANGGTIFLDELGELPLALQTRLLRVLDRGQVRRIGGSKTIDVDVRVVAATNRNLDREVEERRFRLDLYHRLAVVIIRLTPLRDRPGDLELLARRFVKLHGSDEATVLRPEVLERMRRHTWPGNVRELRNYVRRLTVLGDTDLEMMSTGVPSGSSEGTDAFKTAASSGFPYPKARAMAVQAFTDAYVQDMLRRHDGNVSRAAEAAGIARRHFQRLKAKA